MVEYEIHMNLFRTQALLVGMRDSHKYTLAITDVQI